MSCRKETDREVSSWNKAWYAVQTRPRHEFVVARSLRNKGFEEFLPTYASNRIWSDRQKKLSLPLFPGYVFCRFEPQKGGSVVTTPGIIRILGKNSGIPESEIEAIRAVVAHRIPAKPCARLQIGTMVQVSAGPLTGVRGVLLSYHNESRLVLSVAMVQNSVSVEIDCSNVVAVQGDRREIQ